MLPKLLSCNVIELYAFHYDQKLVHVCQWKTDSYGHWQEGELVFSLLSTLPLAKRACRCQFAPTGTTATATVAAAAAATITKAHNRIGARSLRDAEEGGHKPEIESVQREQSWCIWTVYVCLCVQHVGGFFGAMLLSKQEACALCGGRIACTFKVRMRTMSFTLWQAPALYGGRAVYRLRAGMIEHSVHSEPLIARPAIVHLLSENTTKGRPFLLNRSFRLCALLVFVVCHNRSLLSGSSPFQPTEVSWTPRSISSLLGTPSMILSILSGSPFVTNCAQIRILMRFTI